MSTYYLYTDGSACPNPGRGGVGAVVKDDNQSIIIQGSEFLGEYVTNNEAEYEAVLYGLTLVPDDCISLHIRVDSKLVKNQLTGSYAVKSPNMVSLYKKLRSKLNQYDNWTIKQISRSKNSRADRLARKAVKQGP